MLLMLVIMALVAAGDAKPLSKEIVDLFGKFDGFMQQDRYDKAAGAMRKVTKIRFVKTRSSSIGAVLLVLVLVCIKH